MALNEASEVLRRVFRPKHDYLPGTTIFREIDLDLLADELRLDEKARQDGADGFPPTEGTTPTVAEREIQRRLRRLWEEAIQGAKRAREGYASRWAGLTPRTHVQTLNNDPEVVASHIRELSRTEGGALEELFEEYQSRARELQRFRDVERIERPPDKPKPMAFKVLGIATAFAIEFIINLGPFAQGNEFGLIGAFFYVFAIPAINMATTGLTIYFGGRQILRRGVFAKAVGVVSIALAVVIAIGFNLGIAHVRDALVAGSTDDASAVGLAQMQSHPFMLAGMNSWILFGGGVLASIIGATEACIWKDPHPGYDKRSEAVIKAAQLFEDRRASAVVAITNTAQKNLEEFRNAFKAAETADSRRPEWAARSKSLAEDLTLYRQHLCDIGDHLAARYREGNLRTRQTPAPSYFREPFDTGLHAVSLGDIDWSEDDHDSDSLLEEAVRTVTRAKEQALADLPILMELKKSSAM